jgi:hypothetical protein
MIKAFALSHTAQRGQQGAVQYHKVLFDLLHPSELLLLKKKGKKEGGREGRR